MALVNLIAVDGRIAVGALDEAERLLERFMASHPNHPRAIRSLAKIRRLQGRAPEAAALLEGLLHRSRIENKHTSQPTGGLTAEDHDYLMERAECIARSRVRYIPGEELEPAADSEPAQKDFIGNPPVPSDMDPFTPLSVEKVPRKNVQNDPVDTSKDGEPFSSDEFDHDTTHPLFEDENVYADGVLEIPDRFDNSDVGISADDVEPDLLDDYLFDFEEAPTREELEADVQIEGPVDRRQRAYQHARELGIRYGWDLEGIELLTEVFERYWWSAAKRSMEREIEAGLVPGELHLALHTRDLWLNYPEFSMSLGRFRHVELSWPTAIRVARAFGPYPDIAEIERFLYETYEEWKESNELLRIYRSFYDYLVARLSFPSEIYGCSPIVRIGDDYDVWEDEYYSAVYAGLNTPEYQDLADYGLVLNEPADVIPRGCRFEVEMHDEQ